MFCWLAALLLLLLLLAAVVVRLLQFLLSFGGVETDLFTAGLILKMLDDKNRTQPSKAEVLVVKPAEFLMATITCGAIVPPCRTRTVYQNCGSPGQPKTEVLP